MTHAYNRQATSTVKHYIYALLTVTVAGCSTQAPEPSESPTQQPPAAVAPEPIRGLSSTEQQAYREALANMAAGRDEAAEQRLRQLHKAKPGLAGPALNLGLLYLRTERFEDALAIVQNAVAAHPERPQGHFLLGLIHTKQHRYREAEEHYRRAIAHNDQFAEAHYNLALLYDNYFQQIDKAVPHYEAYLALTQEPDQATIDWVNHLKNNL